MTALKLYMGARISGTFTLKLTREQQEEFKPGSKQYS